jgi:hypothetical protein
MLSCIKDSKMERALFFEYSVQAFGALKDDGNYRLLWNWLTSKRPWFTNINGNNATIASTRTSVIRTAVTGRTTVSGRTAI